MTYRIRPGQPGDIPRLAEVELAAALLFPVGRVPDPDQVVPEPELAEACTDGLLFVADLHGSPVGFAICSVVCGCLHLDELAVHPDHGRRGLGRRLVQRVIDEAASRALHGVSLTTFADLPWNGPFYTRMAFRTLEDGELNDFLQGVLAAERAKGLTRRIAMIRPIGDDRT